MSCRGTARSGSATRTTSECPRGARMALKDYSDNEAVRSRGQDLVSTSPPSFSDVQTCASCRCRQMWDGSPAAGRSLCQKGGVETHRGELYAEPHVRGSATRITSECPRGARVALKDYSDNEAYDLGNRTWYPHIFEKKRKSHLRCGIGIFLETQVATIASGVYYFDACDQNGSSLCLTEPRPNNPVS